MTRSIADPRLDFETNAFGTFNLLNAVKQYHPEAVIFYSSTNKVYGGMENVKVLKDWYEPLKSRDI